MSRERTWVVPPTIDVQFDEGGHPIPGTGRVDPDAFAQAMVELSSTLLTVGGACTVGPVRREVHDHPLPGVYETHAVVFTWQSFVPAVEVPEPPQAEEELSAEGREPEQQPSEDPERMSVAEPQPVEA